MKNKKSLVIMLSLVMVLATAVTASAQFLAVYNAVPNGDFELGNNGDWEEYSSNGYGLLCTMPYCEGDGSYSMWLGGAPNESNEIRNKIFLSYFNSITPQLTFDYHIDATETSCDSSNANWIIWGVYELNEQGQRTSFTALDSMRLCQQDMTPQSGLVSSNRYDLSSYRGRWIEIAFYYSSYVTNGGYSSIYIDNVEIEQDMLSP